MRLRSPFRVFHDRGGNVALITGLCILPLAFLVGMAIDLSNATRVRVALQAATDSAALAVARNLSTIADNAAAEAAAKNYLDASYDKSADFTVKAAINKQALEVVLDAKASVPTIFAGILGRDVIVVSANSVVKGQGADYEIALALDNSGSMGDKAGSGNTKITELKAATTALFDAMLTSANSGHVKIGIVPFAASVNVGPVNRSAEWMDNVGQGETFDENFSTATKRFNLFDQNQYLTNVPWAGCVESRLFKDQVNGAIKDYDVNDTVPTTSTPDTMFQPMFAPDEPDGDNFRVHGPGKYDFRKGTYSNNYLNDEGGACSGTDASERNSDADKQARICKYKGVSLPRSGYNGAGPNYGCTTTAITPLTNTRATLNAANTAMAANGNTNILEGTMWAWRVLSPTAPFTEGAEYNKANLYKIMIIMTDGLNNYAGKNNYNNSEYFSYGYSRLGRIGTTSNATSTLITALDGRTKKACDNAKAAGIIIYTVGLGSSVNTSLLSYCASKPAYAFTPKNGSDLTPTFQEIAASITKLRIAE